MTNIDLIDCKIDYLLEDIMHDNIYGSVSYSNYCDVDESLRDKVVKNESIMPIVVKNAIGKTVRKNLLERNKND